MSRATEQVSQSSETFTNSHYNQDDVNEPIAVLGADAASARSWANCLGVGECRTDHVMTKYGLLSGATYCLVLSVDEKTARSVERICSNVKGATCVVTADRKRPMTRIW
jgi:hypothetical protein